MSICIFPGTFNPIHYAHIQIAVFALNTYGFDKIIFIPSYIPPHKNIDKNLAKHRFNMVKMATQFNPKFEVSDIEYQNEGKSYSLITVKKIISEYNINVPLNFIIGTDAFKNIRNWYNVDELKKLVHFIVFKRNNDTISESEFSDFDYEVAQMKKIDISSTELRNGEKINALNTVRKYIKDNELYVRIHK